MILGQLRIVESPPSCAALVKADMSFQKIPASCPLDV